MSIAFSPQSPANEQELMLVRVPATVMGLSIAYSGLLGILERRFPIKPDHTWAEVAGGVLITLLPAALESRRFQNLDWKTYESTVWRCFVAAGVPIILWQLGEAIIRQEDLDKYSSKPRWFPYADTAAPLANRSGSGTRDLDPDHE